MASVTQYKFKAFKIQKKFIWIKIFEIKFSEHLGVVSAWIIFSCHGLF